MNWVTEDSISFWRWCSLAESPVFTTIRLGEHVTIAMHDGEDEEGNVTKVRITRKTQCDDCEPEGCAECWFNLKGSLTVVSGGATDEGYSECAELYEFDGDVLTRMTDTSGRDCDGRVDYHYEDVATDLAGWVPHYHSDEPNPGVKVPKWEKVCATQRDYTAEAAGY